MSFVYTLLLVVLQGIARGIENCFTSILHLLTGVESALAICASTSSAEEVDKLVHHGKQILQEAILGKPYQLLANTAPSIPAYQESH